MLYKGKCSQTHAHSINNYIQYTCTCTCLCSCIRIQIQVYGTTELAIRYFDLFS